MGKITKDWFTGIDGQTFDLGRALWASASCMPILAAGVQVAGSIISFWREIPLHLWHAEDWATWSAGISAILAGGAGALALKKGTEPSSTSSSTIVSTPGAVASETNQSSTG